jgi:hypothetical protein
MVIEDRDVALGRRCRVGIVGSPRSVLTLYGRLVARSLVRESVVRRGLINRSLGSRRLMGRNFISRSLARGLGLDVERPTVIKETAGRLYGRWCGFGRRLEMGGI